MTMTVSRDAYCCGDGGDEREDLIGESFYEIHFPSVLLMLTVQSIRSKCRNPRFRNSCAAVRCCSQRSSVNQHCRCCCRTIKVDCSQIPRLVGRYSKDLMMLL